MQYKVIFSTITGSAILVETKVSKSLLDTLYYDTIAGSQEWDMVNLETFNELANMPNSMFKPLTVPQ